MRNDPGSLSDKICECRSSKVHVVNLTSFTTLVVITRVGTYPSCMSTIICNECVHIINQKLVYCMCTFCCAVIKTGRYSSFPQFFSFSHVVLLSYFLPLLPIPITFSDVHKTNGGECCEDTEVCEDVPGHAEVPTKVSYNTLHVSCVSTSVPS